MNIRLVLAALLLVCACLSGFAEPGNVWHIPTASENGLPGTMRSPSYPGASTATTFYQGVWKGWPGTGGVPNGFDPANQTGGKLHYRVGGGAWTDVALAYHSDVNANAYNHNQFWKATISMPAQPAALVEYFFEITFSNRDTTYLHGNNQIAEGADSAARLAAAQAAPTSLTVSYPTPQILINGVNSNYSKSNFYIDENNDNQFPTLDILFTPNLGNLTDVEIFTNLNQRERANQDYNNDGIEDGIIPPSGHTITTSDTGAYFRAYPMNDLGNGTFQLTLPVQKTGAYRVTGRYKVQGNPNWIWVGDSGIRDHAVVVAPKKARDMVMYELHVANSNATGPSFAQRGTIEALHNPASRVNIQWLQGLGVNWIWFQPIHPQGIEGRQIDPATNQEYDPGSPYSIRNFWEVNPLYSSAYDMGLPDAVANPANYAAAMNAFANFTQAADAGGIHLMLDFPFNHTAPDVVLGQKGVELFGGPGNPGGWTPNTKIRESVPQFFSTNGGEGSLAYSQPAQSSAGLANAPDRDDFGKWNDVRDVFFGRYATLVTGYPGAESSRATTRNEGDWMDYSSLGSHTVNVWRYFGEVLPYWITQSGHRGFNSTTSDGNLRDALDAAGIDGLRKDFGQGLPPQCMEYIINRTHSVKWNFVFMSESLDGGEVTYRSSRHFAVLNENIVFPLEASTTSGGYRGVFEGRTNAYGRSLVLLNNTSHDERPYADPWQALIRYAAASTNDGSPMIMYGQEIGTAQQGSFDHYELNFGKDIPHFKKWNSMQPQWTAWDANQLGAQFLKPVYSGIGLARQFSPALRSIHRWFLYQHGDSADIPEIFGVAKFTQPFASLASQDVVLGFVNLQRDSSPVRTFGIPQALADRMGLQSGRLYNIKNIAAYLGRNNEHPSRRDQWLWGGGRSGSDILNQGVPVLMNRVPTAEADWATAPYEAQFLKFYDVTAPSQTAGQPAGPNPYAYAIGNSVLFTWTPAAVEAGVAPWYRVNVTIDGSPAGSFITGSTSYVATASAGQNVSITVQAVNPHITAHAGPASTTSTTIRLLTPQADEDGDGQSNAAEHLAGTDPLTATSVLKVTSASTAGNTFSLTWTSVPGKIYAVQTSPNLTDTFTDVSPALFAGPGEFTKSWSDPAASGERKFYRVRVVTPQ